MDGYLGPVYKQQAPHDRYLAAAAAAELLQRKTLLRESCELPSSSMHPSALESPKTLDLRLQKSQPPKLQHLGTTQTGVVPPLQLPCLVTIVGGETTLKTGTAAKVPELELLLPLPELIERTVSLPQ